MARTPETGASSFVASLDIAAIGLADGITADAEPSHTRDVLYSLAARVRTAAGRGGMGGIAVVISAIWTASLWWGH